MGGQSHILYQKSVMGPSLYYVSIFLAFLDPTHCIYAVLNVSKTGHFLDSPTQSFCWRNIGMVITKLCLSPLVLTFCTIVKLSIKETVYDPGWHKCTPYLLYLSTYCPISLLSFTKEDIAEHDKMFLTISALLMNCNFYQSKQGIELRN